MADKLRPQHSVYGVITADADIIAAPAASNALGLLSFFLECTVAEAGKITTLVDGDGKIIAQLSLETAGNSISFNYGQQALMLTESKKLALDTTGTGTGATAYSVVAMNELS